MAATPEEPPHSTRFTEPPAINSPMAPSFSTEPLSPSRSPWAPHAPPNPHYYHPSSPVRSDSTPANPRMLAHCKSKCYKLDQGPQEIGEGRAVLQDADDHDATSVCRKIHYSPIDRNR